MQNWICSLFLFVPHSVSLLSLYVSVFYCVYSIYIFSCLECGPHCTNGSKDRSVRCLQHLSNDWIDSAWNLVLGSLVLCVRSHVWAGIYTHHTHNMYIIYRYIYLVYDFAVLSWWQFKCHYNTMAWNIPLESFEQRTNVSNVRLRWICAIPFSKNQSVSYVQQTRMCVGSISWMQLNAS